MVNQANAHLIARLKSFSGVSALFTFFVGTIVMAGWIFNIVILTRLSPELPKMVPNTASSFILLGISLWLLRAGSGGRRSVYSLAPKILSFAVVLIGALSLAEYLFDWNLGIDDVISRKFFGSLLDIKPIRMAPHTALDFVIIGLSVFLIDTRFRLSDRISQYLALIGLLVSLTAFVGYAYGFSYFVGTMAVHTASAFFLLSLGVLFARPDQGLMVTVTSDSAGGIMIRRLAFVVMIAPIITGLLVLLGERADYYDALFSLSLFTVILITVFGFLLLSNSEFLNNIDNERRKAKSLSDSLNDINSIINSTLSIDRIMRRVLAESGKTILSESAGIFLREDEDWILKYHYKLPAEWAATRFKKRELPIEMFLSKGKKAVAVGALLKREENTRQFLEKYQIRSLLSVPLISKETIKGFLFFGRKTTDSDFTDIEIDFATKLSLSVTFAIESARAREVEKNIADTLQDALITMPNKIRGVRFSHYYHSASEAAKVGGDFYDLYELEHDRVAILIGDVAGSGLEAAALTAEVKSTIRAYSFESESPATIVKKTNDYISKISDPAAFVTLFFSVLDLKKSRLNYCNAGHPPIILKKGSEITYLSTDDLPIGFIGEIDFHEKEEILEKDDVLIFYTDGLIEARRDKEFYGEERLSDLIADRAAGDTDAILGLISKDILKFTNNKLNDDLAVLVISLNP